MLTIPARTIVVVLVAFLAACSAESMPTMSTVPVTPTPVRPVSNFPPLIGPSRTFVFDQEAGHPVNIGTEQSRFVLYDNGAFVLRYPNLVGVGYRGSYETTNGTIAFEWEGWSTAGSWGATGTLNGDRLTVRYNLIMQLSDFEDAIYRLVR
jgi:hypothetical protein